MKTSTKAFCLSAFLFPGSGHFYLKCHVRGFIFSLVAVIGLYFIMSAAFTIALTIANDIQLGKVALNTGSIRNLVQQAMGIYQEPTLVGAKLAIVGSWIISSIDAFREGKKQEKREK